MPCCVAQKLTAALRYGPDWIRVSPAVAPVVELEVANARMAMQGMLNTPPAAAVTLENPVMVYHVAVVDATTATLVPKLSKMLSNVYWTLTRMVVVAPVRPMPTSKGACP